jgi:hypothetical protein
MGSAIVKAIWIWISSNPRLRGAVPLNNGRSMVPLLFKLAGLPSSQSCCQASVLLPNLCQMESVTSLIPRRWLSNPHVPRRHLHSNPLATVVTALCWVAGAACRTSSGHVQVVSKHPGCPRRCIPLDLPDTAASRPERALAVLRETSFKTYGAARTAPSRLPYPGLVTTEDPRSAPGFRLLINLRYRARKTRWPPPSGIGDVRPRSSL